MSCAATRHDPTASAYTYGCRCPGAREAWRLYNKRRRQGRALSAYVDATGTRRRLGALLALGHTAQYLAQRMGRAHRNSVLNLLRADRVHRATAAEVAELYDRLSMTVGPSARVAARAERVGFPPPFAWNDDEIDDPKARPHGMPSQVIPRPGRRKVAAA